MASVQENLIDRVAEQLELDADELIVASLESYLYAQLRRVEADIASVFSSALSACDCSEIGDEFEIPHFA